MIVNIWFNMCQLNMYHLEILFNTSTDNQTKVIHCLAYPCKFQVCLLNEDSYRLDYSSRHRNISQSFLWFFLPIFRSSIGAHTHPIFSWPFCECNAPFQLLWPAILDMQNSIQRARLRFHPNFFVEKWSLLA